ncbi:serine/threonine-protein kinase Nek10-like [Haliotis rufescens]|uniref:serine/threonine-protein kinase Nek10-like n=1 Tax=Haliotis rufescens TaxID=6454 RepID=UPI00201E8CD3|nr:serine/threonine-protein kinase Nek10-like [Haliotis rufescens]XP_048237262.1 serine/threonine-protein kinase Nek10-like [Haliotis rufescens]
MPSMQEKRRRSPPDPDQEPKDLCRLLSLISTPASKQQLPSLSYESCDPGSGGDKWPRPQPKSGSHQHQSTEAVALETFSQRYQNERHFSHHSQHAKFTEIFSSLTKHRLCCSEWTIRAPPENVLRVLICVRILMRDSTYQKQFFQLGGVKHLSEHFKKATDSYLRFGDEPFLLEILKEMTNIFQKLSAVTEQREWLVACEAHQTLVLLLAASDVFVLHSSLYALIGLAQSPKPRQLIGELSYCIEILLRFIQEYDTLSKKLAASLLRYLCADAQSRDLVRLYDGVPILLSQLHSDNVNLLWHVVWCIVQLCSDTDTSSDIRQLGGIPLLLSLLHDRTFVTERSEASDGAMASAGIHGRTPAILDAEGMEDYGRAKRGKTKQEEIMYRQYDLKSACCAALTELVLNDTNAQQIVQANGVYSLGLLILPHEAGHKESKTVEKLQRNAFRALRFLFSMERNRRLFKCLFPPKLYEIFIDVGHYNKDLSAYKKLVHKMNSLPKDQIEEIRENICDTNQERSASKYIGDYAVFELLGSGAFGSVFKVKKRSAGQTFLALKELNLQHSAFGKNAKEKEQSVGEIQNELNIIRQELRHPNIVRYCKTFVECDRLYIVMELIEGAPLGEHFNSLKEKKEKFQETRIWNIFMQMVLALRYLHKEKGIVHRDLTPNNIMLGENDKVTFTDFGLAKQKRSDCSKMTSVVGTILYSCPEIVQNQPYGEKADMWALGCILYQMCTLNPPFFSNNMLTLATKIVEADYTPIPEEDYSERLRSTIRSCITACPESRPDILQLSGQLVDILLVNMDTLRIQQASLERKLDRERKRTQKHFFEANRNMQNYHKLFLASQERYDKLANLSASGGAAGFKDSESSDGVFLDGMESRKEKVSSSSSSTDHQDTEQETVEQGWTSDDESCPSSGSESRESSAGSTRSRGRVNSRKTSSVPQPPTPSTPKLFRDARRRAAKRDPFSLLTLEIPNQSKASRDSGLSSGDPSPNNSHSSITAPIEHSLVGRGDNKPNFRRSQSSNDTVLAHASRKLETRSRSAATLAISPNRLREISDPIIQMLHQLHKIIYVTQMPPTLCPNSKRRMIEQFKRALFSPNSTSMNLKNELRKLLQGSRDVIDLNLGVPDTPRKQTFSLADQEMFSFSTEKLAARSYNPDFRDVGITYEQMQNMIDDTLVDCGYYSVSARQRQKTPPLTSVHDVFRSRMDSFGS